jgi:hypothetical protein
MRSTPVEVQFTSAGCLNYPCRTPIAGAVLQEPPKAHNVQPGQQAENAPSSQKQSEPYTAADNGGVADDAHQRGEQEGSEYWPRIFGLHLKITDSLLAVFTLFLVVVGGGQGLLIKRQIKDAATKQRAFVFLKTCIFTGSADVNTKKIIHWKSSVRWENAGETPNRYMRVRINRELTDAPLGENFDFIDHVGGASIPTMLGPKSNIDSDEVDVPINDMIMVGNGTKHLYLWGWAEYDDIFRKTERHRTEFCYKISLTGDATNPDPAYLSFRWSLHSAHNGSDDKCVNRIRSSDPYGPRPKSRRSLRSKLAGVAFAP